MNLALIGSRCVMPSSGRSGKKHRRVLSIREGMKLRMEGFGICMKKPACIDVLGKRCGLGVYSFYPSDFSQSQNDCNVFRCSVVSESLRLHRCSLPSSSVHGILQTRILEWVAMSSSRGSSWSRGWIHVSHGFCTAGWFFTTEPLGSPFLGYLLLFALQKLHMWSFS